MMREPFTPTRVFRCRDCEREGVAAPQTIDEYYIRHTASGLPQCSRYCKRHDDARAARAARRKVLTCADCAREGVEPPQTIDEYYIWTNSKTGEQHRSRYCKRHESARQAARQRARMQPDSPQYDADYHERQKKRAREYMRSRYKAKKGA